MSKKHFIQLAAALKNNRPDNSPNRLAQWRSDVGIVARTCEAVNPRFDLLVFLTACGFTDSDYEGN